MNGPAGLGDLGPVLAFNESEQRTVSVARLQSRVDRTAYDSVINFKNGWTARVGSRSAVGTVGIAELLQSTSVGQRARYPLNTVQQ
jgi:hypothetical protein